MNSYRKVISIGLVVFAFAGAICVAAQTKRPINRPAATPVAKSDFTRITQAEIQLLLVDVLSANPSMRKTLEDPEMRRGQLDNLRDLLTFARQAEKEGLTTQELYRAELKNIHDETVAVNYDAHLNKGPDRKGQFETISDAQIQAYWGETGSLASSLKASRAAKFEEFLKTKISILTASVPAMKDKPITAEETAQARDMYAKIQISAAAYAKASRTLPKSLHDKIALQSKLQRAQFLARMYSERIASTLRASDEEVASYIKSHPQLDPSAQRVKANEVLSRAKAGEDFAKLANEFSEDPGNRNAQNELQGGIYRDVRKGVMVPAFEFAALALEAGQISPNLVESDFGFHIVKLERKGKASAGDTEETYDVRHILFATTLPNTDDPNGRPTTIRDHARTTIEDEKEKQLIDRLVIANQISVPDDFVVPALSERPVEKASPPAKRRAARKKA